ncbi:protein max-like [Amphiura filiformis]|uniref:protein max-like n=1 Tax=Amphiura filiformis TaxID=82378 RepID=UPI003B211E92
MSDEEGELDLESEAEKRAHHNALERKRRDHIKDSFNLLRDAVPNLQGEKVHASRAQILNKATEYIQFMRRKNNSHQNDIEDLKKQNLLLDQQIRLLEKTGAGDPRLVDNGLALLTSKGGTVSAFDGGSGSESESDDDSPSSRKRLKTEASGSTSSSSGPSSSKGSNDYYNDK